MSGEASQSRLQERSPAEAVFDAAITGLTELQLDHARGAEINPVLFAKFRADILRSCGGRRVYVTGPELLTPAVDQFGHVVGISGDTSSISGEIEEVVCTERPDGSEGFHIGLKLELGTSEFENLVESSRIVRYGFAPVISSSFVLEPEEERILPDPEDDIAETLDTYLLNEPFDFEQLQACINELFRDMNDLQQEYYLGYINSLCQFGLTTCLTQQILIIDEENDLKATNFADPQIVSGIFERFLVVTEHDRESHLLIRILCGKNRTPVQVSVDALQDIEIYAAKDHGGHRELKEFTL